MKIKKILWVKMSYIAGSNQVDDEKLQESQNLFKKSKASMKKLLLRFFQAYIKIQSNFILFLWHFFYSLD